MWKLLGLKDGQMTAVDGVWVCNLGVYICVDRGAGYSWVWEDKGAVLKSEAGVGSPLDAIL